MTAPVLIPAFYFDEDSHTYFEDGVAVPSTTQIISACGMYDFSMVDPEVLARKAQLGRLVHQACHFYDEGDLDESTLHPEVAPRLSAYKRFRAETGYQPVTHELPQVAHVQQMQWGMTYDSDGLMGRMPWLIDIKNAATETPAWGVQLASYEMALPRPLPFMRRTRVVVQLFETGKYKLHTYADCADYDIWRACYLMAVQPPWATEEQIRQAAQAVRDWKENHKIK